MYVERLSMIYIGTSSNITIKISSPQPENSVKETSSPLALAKNAIKVQWFTTFQWVFFMVAFILTATALGSCNEIKFSNTSGTSTPSSMTLQFGT